MGKQGPCYHCGVTSTPLWRNGPPEKPVLCNACGSRWRTKGTLTNYTPLHARADTVVPEDFKVSKVKSIVIKSRDQRFHKRKLYGNNVEVEAEELLSDQNFRKEEDTSNRSSSGSAVSYSESCANVGGADVSDWTGSAQSNVWESLVPSRKRTCVSRPKSSSVEKLTRDLHCILHEQSSNISVSSEEDLLFESGTPLVSVEIGHGGVLIRHPNSLAREESEASSIPVDNKVCSLNDGSSGLTSHPVNSESDGMSLSIMGHEKGATGKRGLEYLERDDFLFDKFHILQSSDSPLGYIDLRDVVSFKEFMTQLTHEEQQLLMEYLPQTDTAMPSESLGSMFQSPQFVDTLFYFQQLLLEGVFDPSFTGADSEGYRVLKRLAIVNLKKSEWAEHYQQLKGAKSTKAKDGGGVPAKTCGTLAPEKRHINVQYQNFSGAIGTLKSHRRMQKCSNMNLPSIQSPQQNSSYLGVKQSYDTKDMYDDGSCFSPRSLFVFPPDRNSIMLDSLQFTDESYDQDLLFNVPSNAPCPETELLHYYPQKQTYLPEGLLANSRIPGKENTLSNLPSSSLSSQQLTNGSNHLPHLVLP